MTETLTFRRGLKAPHSPVQEPFRGTPKRAISLSRARYSNFHFSSQSVFVFSGTRRGAGLLWAVENVQAAPLQQGTVREGLNTIPDIRYGKHTSRARVLIGKLQLKRQ